MMTTFCCCIPTRLAVLILAPITAFFSTVFSIGLIKGLIDYWNTLRMNHQISLILLTIVVVVVAIASVMGFFGAIVRNFNSVNAYSQTLYSLCVAFLIVGIVNIVLMFKGRQELIDSCERQQDQPEWSCKRTFDISYAVVIALWGVILLFALYLARIVRRYAEQLYTEQSREGMPLRTDRVRLTPLDPSR